MNNGKSVNAIVPVAALRDAVQIIANANHVNYTFQQVAGVVNALNQCAEMAIRESGISVSAEHGETVKAPTGESGTDHQSDA